MPLIPEHINRHTQITVWNFASSVSRAYWHKSNIFIVKSTHYSVPVDCRTASAVQIWRCRYRTQ